VSTSLERVALLASGQLLTFVIAFALTLGFAAACVWVAPTPALRKWCWCMPLVKALWDLARGAPSGAYVQSGFAGQPWDLGGFHVGVGAKAPLLLLFFSGRFSALRDRHWFPLSSGDQLVHALWSRGFRWPLCAVLVAVTAVGALRGACQIASLVRSARREARARRGARQLGSARVLGRAVPILVAPSGLDIEARTGVRGLLFPAIWLGPWMLDAPVEEREAVIQHELCHVRMLDVPLFAALELCRALFWFVPGMAWLERRVRADAELAADASAVRYGANGLALASAIAREGEARAGMMHPTLGGKPVLERVRRLTSTGAPAKYAPMRAVLTTYLGVSILESCFGGY
jgi:hypothetical protein